MQVDWYRSFTEAVKWKSLSKAAVKLNLTQPAVSKHIRSLEEAFGVELFRRGASGVELTEAGMRFLQRIAPVVAEIESIKTEMREFAERPNYILGSLPSVAAHVLPGKLRELHDARYPLAVSVRPTSGELLEGVLNGAFDAALIDEPAAGRLWSRELFTEHFVAIFPEGHRFSGCEELSIAELAEESFVFTGFCNIRERVTEAAGKYGYKPAVKLEVDSYDYLLGMITVGNDITVLPELFRKQAKRLGLKSALIKECGLRRTISLVARTAETGSKMFRLLNSGVPQEYLAQTP
ncbi:LysR family transcriptional regulator [Paenibacillus thalictri]|nr:LysR family transcriptional regulator [Paenibacillus thalictri]